MSDLSESPEFPERAQPITPTNPLAQSKGRLIVQVRFGLGNRLNAFLSTLIVGEILGVQIEIGWPFRHEECAARFSDLFSNDGLTDARIRDDDEIFWDLPKAHEYPLDTLKSELMAGRDVMLSASELYGETLLEGWQFQERVRMRLRSLRLAAEVQKLIQDGPEPSIGLHVRLSDHIPCHIYSPTWCYFETVRSIGVIAPDEKILLCADTPSVALMLSARFPQILLAPSLQLGLSLRRDQVVGMQAALADLCMLARCSIIFASPLSSFARVARLLGGAQRFDVLAFGSAENFRGSYIAWAMQNSFHFDLGERTRKINPDAATHDPVRARGYFLLGNFFMSRFYQRIAFPTGRSRLRRQIRNFFNGRKPLSQLTGNPGS